MREESILKVPHSINQNNLNSPRSQGREIHEALPTFWQPIGWINTEKGQADRPMQPGNMQSTSHSREPQKYLRNTIVSSITDEQPMKWGGCFGLDISQLPTRARSITFLQKFQKTFKGGNLAITVN